MSGIDTMRFYYPGFILDKCPSGWEYHPVISSGSLLGESYEYSCKITNDVISKYVYYPNKNSNTPPSLFISCSSVPRMIYGNNYTSITEFSGLWDCVQKELQKDPYSIIPYDVKDAELSRLDIFRHYDVGCENISSYLDVISKAIYPQRERGPYRNSNNTNNKLEVNNGYTFSSTSVNSNFYDKYLQCGEVLVKGHIRHEIQLSSASVIRAKFHFNDPKCMDITPGFIHHHLEKDLEVMRLDHSILDKYSAERVLIDKYGNREGSRLLDLCVYMKNHPTLSVKQTMANRGINDRDHFIKQMRKIYNAGITPYLMDSVNELPKLPDCVVTINEKKTGST